ncbi:hypothetical protein PF008_g5888 [Phytophthora fragariae]|uniref:Uncharacterized protein n=1 Tax=Phytophthora fragariae TaxID=53985 RepID=A0A6G0S703_9STRA|nr:hypothetical protein PF008_g5888 [Phytophthora fragariae]
MLPTVVSPGISIAIILATGGVQCLWRASIATQSYCSYCSFTRQTKLRIQR